MSDSIQPESQTAFQRKFSLPSYWKLATIRCSIYAIVVGANAFMAGVEGYDALSVMTPLQKGKLCLNILIAMLGVWIAFIDNSMNKKPDQKP
jgi:hypothetical protein